MVRQRRQPSPGRPAGSLEVASGLAVQPVRPESAHHHVLGPGGPAGRARHRGSATVSTVGSTSDCPLTRHLHFASVTT